MKKKISWAKACELCYQRNTEANITSQFEDEHPLKIVVVFKQGNWFKQEYTEEERSYRFRSDNKFFIRGMGGNSIFGDCLDKSEHGIRIDWYLGKWKIDYCYVEE